MKLQSMYFVLLVWKMNVFECVFDNQQNINDGCFVSGHPCPPEQQGTLVD